MKRYGERFLTAGNFVSHCRELNVRVRKEELEHYEKSGVMFPVVRRIYPDEYIVEQAKIRFSGGFEAADTTRWPELQRLKERLWLFPFPEGLDGLGDEELVHCFDREIDANPYLTRPNAETFKAWNEYRVQIPDIYNGELRETTAEHYYSYWQVHQLYCIQNSRSPNAKYLADFKGMHRYFDALSFWMTIYLRERGRTFAVVNEVNGFRRLSDSQSEDFQTRLKALAGTVLSRFNFCSNDLYGFLRRLIELYEAYLQDERYKLAEDLKSDIGYLSDLIELTTGANRKQIEGELNHYDARTFRHLDEVNKERDYAVSVMKRVASKCASDLQKYDPNWSFSESEINDLLDYCEQEGLGLLRTALSGMLAIGDDEHRLKYRRTTRYTNMKNILSSYEYLLKSLGDKANLGIEGKTLTRLVKKVMVNENWISCFNARSENNNNLLSAKNTTEFINNLVTIMNDSQLSNSAKGFWARTFLFALSARNGTVHFYPDEDKYYGDLFGEMLNTSVIAMFYTWKLAKRNGWV